MDANAYLKRHGWRGDGHSLDTTNRGIRKPLLVSKKIDVLGVGLNKHAAVSDQWWMRAFDEGLKNLGTDKKSTLSTVREHGIHLGGLYGRFVKGETVEGTIGSGSTSEDDKVKATGGELVGQKRKREDTVQDKRAKRKVDGSSEKAKRLRKDIDRKVKVVLHEADQRGLISASSRKSSKSGSSTKVDEATLVHIFERAGLSSPVKPEEASKKSSKGQKYTREKSLRELKRVAQAHFQSQLSESDLKELRDDEQAKVQRRAAKGEQNEMEKYKRNAEKSMARTAKAVAKKMKAEQRAEAQSSSEDNAGGLSTKKLAKYEERAAAKRISVEEYIRQKEQKGVAEQDQDVETGDLGFVVDTVGDTDLLNAAPALATGKNSIHVIDSDGNLRYTVGPGQSVPLDPSIWEDVDIKTLPKPVREARKAWMAEKRAARKAGTPGSKSPAETAKEKAQRREEDRRKRVRKLLQESRSAMKKGESGAEAGDEKSRVPLIGVTTRKGSFSKEECALARRAVRRMAKQEKRAAKEEGGSTKKSKKIKGPRHAKEMERHMAKQEKK